jgi:hypothetical protein
VFARAFWCDRNHDLVAALEFGRHLVDEVGAAVTHHRNAAQPAPDGAKGAFEEGVFGKEVGVGQRVGAAEDKADKEIQVGCVRPDHTDIFVRAGIIVGGLPPDQAEEGVPEVLHERALEGIGRRGGGHGWLTGSFGWT